MSEFTPLDPPRYNYDFDVVAKPYKSSEDRLMDGVRSRILELENRISRAIDGLDQGLSNGEVVRILQG